MDYENTTSFFLTGLVEMQHNVRQLLELTQSSKEENVLRFNTKARRRYPTLNHLLNQVKSALKKEARHSGRRRIIAGVTPNTGATTDATGEIGLPRSHMANRTIARDSTLRANNTGRLDEVEIGTTGSISDDALSEAREYFGENDSRNFQTEDPQQQPDDFPPSSSSSHHIEDFPDNQYLQLNSSSNP